jgi:uncharacterized protein (DUF2141 family)
MASRVERVRAAALAAAVAISTVGVAAAGEPDPAPPPATGPAQADAAPALVALEVHAKGFDGDLGHAVAKLSRPGENVLDPSSYKRATGTIHAGEARLRFTDLPEGAYALVVFHDENDNGQIDHNAIHLPNEQLGFSNGFRPGLFAGLPTFEKLQFRVARASTAGPVTLEIVVR